MADQLGSWMPEEATIDERLRVLEGLIHGELLVRAAEDVRRGHNTAEEVLDWARKWADTRMRASGAGPSEAARLIEKFTNALRDYQRAYRRSQRTPHEAPPR